MTVHFTTAAKSASHHCLQAWTRALDALAEMREALQHRIWREDADDVHLEADCRAWCELTRALANFLEVRGLA